MNSLDFIKPREDVEFEPSMENPYHPELGTDYYAGLLDERFDDAIKADIRDLNCIFNDWLRISSGESPGTIFLIHDESTTQLVLPEGFVVRGGDVDKPAEPIVMPLHATTTMFLIQRRSGLFACAAVVTCEAERLRKDAPERLALPHMLFAE